MGDVQRTTVWSKLGNRYQRFADAVRDAGVPVGLSAVSLVLVLAAGLLVLFVDQAQEALRVAAEDMRHQPGSVIWLFVAAGWLSAAAWYFARVLMYQFAPGDHFDMGWRGWAVRNLPRLTGCLLWGALGAAFFRSCGGQPQTGGLVMLGGLALAGGTLFFVVTYLRGRRLDGPDRRRRLALRGQTQIRFSELDKMTKVICVAMHVLWLAMLIAVTCTDGHVGTWFGPIAVMFFAIGSWIPSASLLFYFGRHTRIPFLLLLVVAVIVFSWFDCNDNHPVRTLPEKRPEAAAELQVAFQNWLNGRKDKGEFPADAYPVFFVSAEGGGLRAAYNTALILAVIQDRCPAFAQHVFAISGVSGGSVGASVFVALCSRNARNEGNVKDHPAPRRPGPFQTAADAILGQDYLSPLLASGLYPDLVQRGLPVCINRFDRARALERELEKFWRTTAGAADGQKDFDTSFYAFADGFETQAVPGLFLNTTVVETGERMVVNNVPLGASRPGLLYSLDEISSANIRLSTAAALSARFPIITPVAYLEVGSGKIRIADGGYFDNTGTETLKQILDLLRQDSPGRSPCKFKPIILRIGSPFQGLASARDKVAQGPHGLGEIMSPVRTFLGTREARGGLAVAQLESLVANLPKNPPSGGQNARPQAGPEDGQAAMVIPFELVDREVQLPLGWLLSDAARQEMQKQIGAPGFETEATPENRDSLTRVGNVLTRKAIKEPPRNDAAPAASPSPEAK